MKQTLKIHIAKNGPKSCGLPDNEISLCETFVERKLIDSLQQKRHHIKFSHERLDEYSRNTITNIPKH